MALTLEERKYFEMMERLFDESGWQQVMKDAQAQIYQLQADALDVNVCPTWDHVNIVRGRALQLNELLLLPDMIANQKMAREERDE